eukprot:9479934-Pyramimonas_sp.AAC.1
MVHMIVPVMQDSLTNSHNFVYIGLCDSVEEFDVPLSGVLEEGDEFQLLFFTRRVSPPAHSKAAARQ